MRESAKYSAIEHYFLSHIRAFLFGLGEIIRTPLASLLTLIVIGIAMALPTGFYLALNNMAQMGNHWHGKPTITLYLKSQSNAKSLEKALQQNTSIAQIRYISAKVGLAHFAKQAKLGNTLQTLKNNPLPDVLIITPTNKNQTPLALSRLANQLKSNPQIELVQLDETWVKRLYYLVELVQRLIYTLSVLFAIGVVVIIGNTIRLTMQQHRHEIQVYRLIGASARFIIRPLLYRGLLYGLLGGAIAWILVQFTFLLLKSPFEHFLHTYNSQMHHSNHSGIALLMIITCGLLGFFGAYIAAKRYLKQPLSI